jgi:hypothetical protein
MNSRYTRSGFRMNQPNRNGRKKGDNFKQTFSQWGRIFVEILSPAQLIRWDLSQTKSLTLKGGGLQCGLYLTSTRRRFYIKFVRALSHLRRMLQGENLSGRRSWFFHLLVRGVLSLNGKVFSNSVMPVASCGALLNACWSQGDLYPTSVAKSNDTRSRQQADCD